MAVYDLTEKVWNFRFGTWRGRETGKADKITMQLAMLNGAPNRIGKPSVKTPVLHNNKS